jgi:hypothetical protein
VDLSLILALCAGVAIAAACGLRAFLPLLALGLAARAHWIHLTPQVQWLESEHALWALAAATVLEVLGDKVPVVDHFLDAVGTVVRPLAAALGSYALLVQWPAPWGALVAMALGAVALSVHGLKAKVRVGSSVVTLGSANPLLSVAEDAIAFGTVALGLVAPILAAIVLALLIWIVVRRARRQTPAPVPPPERA